MQPCVFYREIEGGHQYVCRFHPRSPLAKEERESWCLSNCVSCPIIEKLQNPTQRNTLLSHSFPKTSLEEVLNVLADLGLPSLSLPKYTTAPKTDSERYFESSGHLVPMVEPEALTRE